MSRECSACRNCRYARKDRSAFRCRNPMTNYGWGPFYGELHHDTFCCAAWVRRDRQTKTERSKTNAKEQETEPCGGGYAADA